MNKIKGNDWKKFIDSQVKTVKVQDSREKQLKAKTKQAYKSIIDTQVQYKAALKQREIQEREKEALDMYKSLNDYEQFKLSQKNLNRLTQNAVFNEYQSQVNLKNKKTQEIAEKERELEQSLIKFNKLAIESTKKIEEQKRSQRISAFQDFLDDRYFENLSKQRLTNEEKAKDKNLINESTDSFYKNQKNYYETLEKIEEKQRLYQNSYVPVKLNEKLKKRSQSQVIKKWENDYEQKTAAIEAIETDQKKKLKKHQIQVLQAQINEKNLKKNQEKIRVFFEKEKSDLGILQNSIQSKRLKEDYKFFQEEYSLALKSQVLEKEQQRLKENLFSKREREINKEILDKSSNGEDLEFKAIPGLHRSHSVMRPYSHLSEVSGFDCSQKNFDHWSVTDKSWGSQKVSSTKHDPITNPIGFSLELNRSFHRGRGLATLT